MPNSRAPAPTSARPPHPVLAAWVIAWLAQMAGLFYHSFGRDPGGLPLFSSPLNSLMLTVPLYTAWLLVVAAISTVAWLMLPPLRLQVSWFGVALAGALVLLAQIDFGLERFRGERLTLAHFHSYGADAMFNHDVFGPVLAQPSYPVVMLGIVALAWVALAVVTWRARRAEEFLLRPTWRIVARLFALAAVCAAPTWIAYYHQRDMAQPSFVRLARDLIYPAEPMTPEHEQRDRAELRRFLDPTGGARWSSDEYPLVRRAPTAVQAAGASQPDIVLFVVESLRGRDVGWGGRAPGTSVTPQLDALAARSVTFPHYIANGDPSPRGFISINAGVWEHRWGFIIANFPNTSLDSIPARLRAQGYRTMALWGGNPSFDNQLGVARRWYDELDFEQPGNALFYFHPRSDHTVLENFMARVRDHDGRRPGQPFFAYVATNGTHTPFDPEDGAPVRPDAGPQERYDRCLRHVDAEIGRVVQFLEARPRGRDTVIIVIGDHSDKTNDELPPELRGLPTDPLVWTAALVHGPEKLVGAPRREVFPASHVDLLPTILAWTGDRGPRLVFGQDLFAPIPVEQRYAVAVNSRGYRLDRGGYTLLVDSQDAGKFWAYRAFPERAPSPVPLVETPFSADEPAGLAERMVFWSYLVEENRVLPRSRVDFLRSAP